jgi:iron complex outermembrane recepter protein
MKFADTRVLTPLVAWIMLTQGVAEAETAAGDSGFDQLQEVVVTAEKRASTVQSTPMSLTAISGTQLTAGGINSVEDLAARVPGISMRTAGPGQTEYEMRGLASSGGSTATVGFYLDETPLSASAVALNGRSVIDPELFDLNRAEVLRGPQGTLYGAGSMGGTIKLVTNPPKLGTFEGAADINGSRTSGGDWNGGGSLMLNFPIGELAALRVVTTDKYVSGWIDRIVVDPFPFPLDPSCGSLHCQRGDVAAAPVAKVIKGVNNERLFSTRAALLVKPIDELSVTGTVMYQRITQDGFNTIQTPPGNEAIYQPVDAPEPYYDSFKLASLTAVYDFEAAQLTSNTSYWKRQVVQSQDSAEALENDFNLTQFIPTVYQETDPTRQISEEVRLTSAGDGAFQWVTGIYVADLHSDLDGHEENPAFANAMGCPTPYSGGNCPPGLAFNITNGGPEANPTGVIFDEAIPNVLKQKAVFGEASYRLTSQLKLTAGLRYFDFKINSLSTQCGVGTGTGNATCTGGASSGKGHNFLPKLNLAFMPTGDLTLYGTVAKGS